MGTNPGGTAIPTCRTRITRTGIDVLRQDELGLCGVSAAIANAIYNATGVRAREYPLTLDKLLPGLPAV